MGVQDIWLEMPQCLLSFKNKNQVKWPSRDNGRGNILDISKIGKNSTNLIENVYLADGLKYNLLSISQLCDKDNCVWFDESQCAIENVKSNDIV